MRPTTAYLAEHGRPLTATTIQRRDLRPDDLAVRVDWCGVCHTDLHALRAAGEDPKTSVVPGHEFTGTVTEVGPAVTGFAVGDQVAVGNIVDSCGVCDMCLADQENFCREGVTLTYGGRDRLDGTTTRGGYASEHVLSSRFAYALPAGLEPAAAAPLLCAGITVWEPLTAFGVGPGTRLGVVGLGGLGHLAVLLGRALGADVTVLTRSPGKEQDARDLGASRIVVSTDAEAMASARGTLDVVIDCVAVEHALAPYLELLALDGTLVSVGFLGPIRIDTLDLLLGRKRLASAGSGGRRRTAELLAFAAEHGVAARVETVPSAQVGRALERLADGDVRFRFVLDMSDLRQDPS